MRDSLSMQVDSYNTAPVDPIVAADELINYAISLRQEAGRSTNRRLPVSARMLLDALDDRKRGLDVIYSTFRGYEPRRAEIDEMIRKMEKESYIEQAS